MPRSTGSKQPQAAAGGGSAHTAPAPKNAVNAIQRFFAGKLELLMLLQFLLDSQTQTKFTWQNYKSPQMNLPEGQLTAEIVARWLLTLLFRKTVQGEPDVTNDVWHRVIVFLRENRECEQLRPLFEFLKKHQDQIYSSDVIPRWVQIFICPICDFDAKNLSDLMKLGLSQPHSFWQNILQGLSLSFLPFWLNKQTDYIRHYLIYELLQQPLLSTVRDIIQTFLREKPLEFFSHMPADLLILMSHYELIQVQIVERCLFNESRRLFIGLPNIFLYNESMQNDIFQEFFRKNFPSISLFLSRTLSFGMSFNDAFMCPRVFFKKLLETRDLLENSGIQIHEMRKYMNLFCWHQSTFFPASLNNYSHFFNQIMLLSDNWKFLFVQLWRIDTSYVSNFHISKLIVYACQEPECMFSKPLFNMLKIFVQQVVVKAPLPNPSTKKILFWWLFIVQSALSYQSSDRDLKINMDDVCQMMGLNISEEELDLTHPRELFIQKIVSLAPMFNVITLVFNFGAFTTRKNFTSETHCYDLSLIGLHPFRVLVYEIKSSLNLHLKPNGSCDRIRTLVTMCEEKRDILLQMDEEDRNFLKALFGSYIRKLVLSEELVQLLHQLSQVFPGGVKQHMFETCLPLKMLDNEKARAKKRSRDLTDPDSYEADCSICRSPYPLPQLGLDVPGDPICRVCSQIFRIKIQKILSGLPFTKIVES
jgi:hypothetical protein